MAASLDKLTVARVLLRKTDAEIDLIASQAESVALGLAVSITNLGLSTTFSREDANVILSAVDHVRTLRAADPAATGAALPASTIAPPDAIPAFCRSRRSHLGTLTIRRPVMLLQSDGTPYPDAALTPAAFSPYFATQESNSRRELWTFRDDTRRQLTASSLQVLRLKSRTLIANYGPANALDYLSWMVGPLKPQSISGDASWSELAEEAFQRIAMSPPHFLMLRGRINFAQAQVRICLFHPWSDGDAFSILTETESGSARVAMREGHQVAQPPEADAVWNNGVKVTGDNFPLAYWFPAQDGSGKGRALPSSAVHHHARFTTLGATRGTPILAHAINHFHDIIETNGFVKQAIKQAALMGLTRLSDSTGNGTPSLHGLGAPLVHGRFSALPVPRPLAGPLPPPSVTRWRTSWEEAWPPVFPGRAPR